jgi:hypothetical protein
VLNDLDRRSVHVDDAEVWMESRTTPPLGCFGPVADKREPIALSSAAEDGWLMLLGDGSVKERASRADRLLPQRCCPNNCPSRYILYFEVSHKAYVRRNFASIQ